MAFEVKEWTDRQVQYPGRRKLIQTIIENVYDIERAEGTVSEPGNAFDATNMNDLEARIKAAFESIRDTNIFVVDKNNHFTAEKLDGVLDELFMFASNGKKAFANAIGGSASSTFQQLANLAASIKQDRDSGKQLIANAIGGSASSTFQQLANLIIQNKNNYYEGVVPSFTISGTNSSPDGSKNISIPFGFVPKIVLFTNLRYSVDYSSGSLLSQISLSNITDQVSHNGFKCGIKNVKKDSVTLWVKASTSYNYTSVYLSDNARIEDTRISKIYAFG